MRRLNALLLATFVAACGGAGEDYAGDDADAMPAAAGISPADVAGTWNMVSMADTIRVPYVLTATDSDMGWTVTFPGRDPLTIEVAMIDGDSIVTITGPFESMLHEGEMVTTRSVMRLQDGMLTGTFTASYDNAEIPALVGTSGGSRAGDSDAME